MDVYSAENVENDAKGIPFVDNYYAHFAPYILRHVV